MAVFIFCELSVRCLCRSRLRRRRVHIRGGGFATRPLALRRRQALLLHLRLRPPLVARRRRLLLLRRHQVAGRHVNIVLNGRHDGAARPARGLAPRGAGAGPVGSGARASRSARSRRHIDLMTTSIANPIDVLIIIGLLHFWDKQISHKFINAPPSATARRCGHRHKRDDCRAHSRERRECAGQASAL